MWVGEAMVRNERRRNPARGEAPQGALAEAFENGYGRRHVSKQCEYPIFPLPLLAANTGSNPTSTHFNAQFWQSVCWIDPFVEPTEFTGHTTFDNTIEGTDINLQHPASTFSAGSLSPGSSFEYYSDKKALRWQDRSSKKDNSTYDRSSFAMCSPHTELYDQALFRYRLHNPCHNRHDYPDMSQMSDFYFTEDDDSTFDNFRRYSGDMNNNVDLCDNPPVGYAQHTCADQNNRTFFRTGDFGRRGLMVTETTVANTFRNQESPVPPRGEAWDMRWTWTKAAQSNGNNWDTLGSVPIRAAKQRHQGRHSPSTNGDSTDPDHVENFWVWSGPHGYSNDDGDPASREELKELLFPIPAYAQLDSAVSYAWNHQNQLQSGCVAGQQSPFTDVPVYGRKKYYCRTNFVNHLSVAPSARGCHMPANPMWAWPGLVVDTERPQCHLYNSETPCDCKHAAWAPIPGTRFHSDSGNDRELFPSPNFGSGTDSSDTSCTSDNSAHSPDSNFDDVKGIWPKNSFEILHGMTGHSHMGRINWDKHPVIFGDEFVANFQSEAGKRLKGLYHHNNTPTNPFFPGGVYTATGDPTNTDTEEYGSRYTQGPYPLRGKNDGLLECPSSIMNKNFEFHQHIMLYSMLKTHDICLSNSTEVDESGLNMHGASETRDTQSWCVNPQLYAHDMCVDWLNFGLEGGSDKDAFAKMCFAVLGDGRTLPGDEEESRIGEKNGEGDATTVDADTIKKMCHCTSGATARNKIYALSQIPVKKQPDVMDACLCRSQARSSRSVVGSFDRFNALEPNPENPEWLKPADNGNNFPMCNCGNKNPCVINRVCSPENLGNRDSPEQDFAADFKLNGFNPETHLYTDPSNKVSDGSIRYDPVPLQFIGRDVPYAKFEMDRMSACAVNPASSECTNTRPQPGIVPENRKEDTDFFSLRFLPGTTFDITAESPGKKLLNKLFCSSAPLFDPQTGPIGAYPENEDLFADLWGDHIPVFTSNTHYTHTGNTNIQISDTRNDGQQSEPGCTLSLHKRPTAPGLTKENIRKMGIWETANIIPTADLEVEIDNAQKTASLYVHEDWYQTKLDLNTLSQIGNCLEYSYRLLFEINPPNEAELTALKNGCHGTRDRVKHNVKLITQTTDVTSAMALGRCFNVNGISEDTVYTTASKTPITDSQKTVTGLEFDFEDQFCEDFRGVFAMKRDTSQPAIFDEICQNDVSIAINSNQQKQSLSCDNGIQKLQKSAGGCVVARNAIPISNSDAPVTITLPRNIVSQEAADADVSIGDVCNEKINTPYIFRARNNKVTYVRNNAETTEIETEGKTYMFDFDIETSFATDTDTRVVDTITIAGADVYICTDVARELIQAGENVNVFFGECGVFTVSLGIDFPSSEKATRLIAISNFESELPDGFDADRGFYCGSEDDDTEEERTIDSCGNKALPKEIQVQARSKIPGVDRAVVELVPKKCRLPHSSPYSRAISETDLPTLNLGNAGQCEDNRFCEDLTDVGSPVIMSGIVEGVLPLDEEDTTSTLSSKEKSFAECHRKCHESPELCSMLKWAPEPNNDPNLPGTCIRHKNYDVRSVSVPTPVAAPGVLTDTTEREAEGRPFLVICPLKTPLSLVSPPEPPRTSFCPVGFQKMQDDHKPGEVPPMFYCAKSLCPVDYFSAQVKDETKLSAPSSFCPDPIEMFTSTDKVITANKIEIIPEDTNQATEISSFVSKILGTDDKIVITYTLPTFSSPEALSDNKNVLSGIGIDIPQLVPLPNACQCQNTDQGNLGIQCSGDTQRVDTRLSNGEDDETRTKRFAVKYEIAVQFEKTDGSEAAHTVELGTFFHKGTTLGEKLHRKLETGGVRVPSSTSEMVMKVIVTVKGAAYLIHTQDMALEDENANPSEFDEKENANPPEFDENSPIDPLYSALYLPSVEITELVSFYTESIIHTETTYFAETTEEKPDYHQMYCPDTNVNTNPHVPPKRFSTEECEDANACILSRDQELFLTICTGVNPVPHGCGGVTVCTESEYEHTPPSGTADRKCLAITTCESSEYEHTPPTASSDRGCAARPDCDVAFTYYSSNPDDPSYDICVPKTGCPHVGSGTDAPVNHVVDSDASTRDVQCVEITTCRTNPAEGEDQEYVSKAHTAVSDRECTTVVESCVENQNYETAAPGESNDRVCTPVSVCLEGETEAKDGEPTPLRDRVCVPLGVIEEAEEEKEAAEPLFDAMLGWVFGGVGVGGMVVALFNAGLLW